MIKRPLDPRFSQAVLTGQKFTTIRESLWPIGVPIMLYNWSGKPYRSKQTNVAAIIVQGYWPITITRHKDDTMSYTYGMDNPKQLHETEGFTSREELDNWFRPMVEPDQTITKTLMRFRLAKDSKLALAEAIGDKQETMDAAEDCRNLKRPRESEGVGRVPRDQRRHERIRERSPRSRRRVGTTARRWGRLTA